MKIALLTHPRSLKCASVAAALAARGVPIALIVCEEPPVAPAAVRLRRLVLERGPRALADKLVSRWRAGDPAPARRAATSASAPDPDELPGDRDQALDAADYAAQHGIALLHLADIHAPASLERLRAETIDLMIHAGAGILRAPLLGVPLLGVLNAHMGMLPRYRGMNVAEWAAWEGGPLGATLHWIDPGIDTGRIIRVVPVARDGLGDVASLRRAVDRAQIEALADLVAQMVAGGQHPAATQQRREDGRQYFTMHPQIVEMLGQRLAQST